jgi:insulysin
MELDHQQKIVTEHFSEINQEYRTILRKISVDPFVDVFKPDFHRKMFYVKSKSKKRKMLITFLLPTIEVDYKNRSLEYLAFLINYEGRDSLMAYFKRQSLALHMVAKIGSRNFEGNSMFTFFTIEVSLTRDGYENFERVLDAIFSYLLIIKITPIEEHKEIFEEFKEVKHTIFKYRKEKPSVENVQDLAVNMRYFNDDDIIIGKEICPDFDGVTMKNMIEKINERKFNLMILSDNYHKYDKIESWFGTEYAEIGMNNFRLCDSTLKLCSQFQVFR